MRVLYVNPSAQLGGAELCLLDMMSEVRRLRPRWQLLLVASSDGPLLERARSLQAVTRILAFPRSLARLGDSGAAGRAGLMLRLTAAVPAILSYRARLRSLIEELQPDIIHTNGLKANLLASWAAENRPVIWHLHDYLGSRPMAGRMARWTLRRHGAALAIANSQSVAQDARAVLGDKLPIRTLYNAVDLQEFSPQGERADLDTLCGLPPAAGETLRVGLVCTMAWWKGQKDFLRALAQLPRQLPVRGYVIGGPIYQTRSRQYSIAELRAFARQLGIEDRAGFTGFTANPAAAMRALDIVVHASTEPEPFGRVIVEAMACGKPVITTAVGGARELITPGSDALTFAAADAAMLAARIAELARDCDRRELLARNGLEHARNHFDRRRLGPALVEIYQSAAGVAASRTATAAESLA
jgi:glycosyltransferase involved in cell wall biosynthesis